MATLFFTGKPLYVSISGVMGSGKTTVCRLLAEHFGLHFFEEQVNENSFLPKYYKDPKTWAFHSQIFYLREKSAQLKKIKEILATTSILQDTPIYQDAFVYAKAQHILGYMGEEEYNLYRHLFDIMQEDLPVPDLIIQLDTSPEVIEERIRRRGRSYEQAITPEYLKLLLKLQDEWLNSNNAVSVLRVATDNGANNIAVNQLYQQQVIENIKTAFNRRSPAV